MISAFLEKWAEAIWTSPASAKLHAKRHAGEMWLSPEAYIAAAQELADRRDQLRQVKDKKWGSGGRVYWDSKTGRKLVMNPAGKIITMFNAGARP